jgi:hypothetical protein
MLCGLVRCLGPMSVFAFFYLCYLCVSAGALLRFEGVLASGT